MVSKEFGEFIESLSNKYYVKANKIETLIGRGEIEDVITLKTVCPFCMQFSEELVGTLRY